MPQLDATPRLVVLNTMRATNPAQRQKSMLLRTWILSGLFFMALPGTLLGFSNLMAISTHHGMGSLPAAWMEGHGHAQMFGWIGSFILGIGFYSQPALHRSAIRLQQTCLSLWVIGVALRWFANIYSWNWRLLFPISAGFELVAVFLFLYAASHHKLPEAVAGKTAKAPMELWMAPYFWERPGWPRRSPSTLSSVCCWRFTARCSPFRTRSIRSTLCCLAGDSLCQWFGASPHAGCPHFFRSEGLMVESSKRR
jgi:hypothetical protein